MQKQGISRQDFHESVDNSAKSSNEKGTLVMIKKWFEQEGYCYAFAEDIDKLQSKLPLCKKQYKRDMRKE